MNTKAVTGTFVKSEYAVMTRQQTGGYWNACDSW